ncbi:hypothetical protein FXF51_47930 [Nonomuraea sp. PA05]|uniref:RICIN domain-containing protein n=1 Tax=Nonomuraea sp. PA05 TaxID=2604466 RepID=UPI0011DB34ED|nr:ricin-type beta-trefoil lectin domain protein [Nonomuraea sp. PA05]TYB54370.1 hypothetical protein FXF51_47930 [Nonomuraea sp. PA05]
MRAHVRELTLEIGVIGGLSALLSVAAGISVNFATDGQPELNPAHIPPAVLFSCLASAVPLIRARWAARTERTTDPYTAQDLAGYKRLLKKLRQEKGTPSFAELERRAAERGLDIGRAGLEKVTKQALRWLDDAEHAEPIIRAFLAVHQVPDDTAGTWLAAYRRLVDPAPPPERRRRVRPAVLVAVPVVCATVASLGYVSYAEARIRGSLYRPHMAVLSRHAPGRYLAVTSSESSPPRARLGPSTISKSPVAPYRWDFVPAKHDGSYHFQIRNRQTRRCLTPEARTLTEGGYITDAACDGSAEQLWRVSDHGVSSDRAIAQGGMCVEPNLGSTDAGAPLVLRSCVPGKTAQRWLITDRMPAGLGSSMASAQNGVCLDAAAGMADLVTWGCHGRANQSFTYRRDARGDYEMKIMDTCLGVSAPRRRPVRETCTGGPGQLWRLTYRSPLNDWLYWEVRHVASDLCLQLEPDLATLSMNACDRSNVQQWRTPEWLRPPDTPVHPAAGLRNPH